jgi:hypothetical protein
MPVVGEAGGGHDAHVPKAENTDYHRIIRGLNSIVATVPGHAGVLAYEVLPPARRAKPFASGIAGNTSFFSGKSKIPAIPHMPNRSDFVVRAEFDMSQYIA